MSKEKLTYVRREEKTSKAGKPYTSFSIKVESRGDSFVSGFGNKGNADWKVGDEVEIDIVQKDKYLNWSTPKLPAGYSFKPELEIAINRIDLNVQAILRMLTADVKDSYPPHTPTAFDNPIE